jgi:deoxyribose-phosphate aldolase
MSVPDPDALLAALRSLRDETSSSATEYVEEALGAVESPTSPGLAGPENLPSLTPAAVADRIDHTQLRPAAADAQIDQVCEEARTYDFAAVCVHPTFVPRVVRRLDGTDVTPCTVVGFPHGANRTVTKAQEAERAVMDGARELDMVLALGAVASGRYSDAEADVRGVVTAAREQGDAVDAPVPVKVILETALLTPAQTAVACVIARRAGADFVKTSTGFASTGARAEDVALMRQVVGADLGVKASGGVGSVADVRRMMAHGATRIGASGSVAIMEEIQAATNPS